MADHAAVVVATGRFQTIHLGSVRYLIAARDLARNLGAEFRILTGPEDPELPVHGHRSDRHSPRRLLAFAERQFLLSLIVRVPMDDIRFNKGSPHHGTAGLIAWADHFLDAVRFEVQSTSQKSCSLLLATVLKKADYKEYKPGDGVRHYSDYLKDRYPELVIVDLAREVGLGGPQGDPSASELPLEIHERAALLPSAMLAAEIIVNNSMNLAEERPREAVTAVFNRFGNYPTTLEKALEAMASFFAPHVLQLPR